MKRFFRTKLPAVLLALTLMAGTIPMAGALTWTGSKDSTCTHSSFDVVEVSSASCTSAGTRLYACKNTKCGAVALEIIPAKGHTFYRYSYDETTHWLVCSVCGTRDTSSIALHRDTNRDGSCDTCGARMNTAADNEIVYEVSPGGRVNLDEDDFNDLFQDTYPNYTLDRVVFDRPDSSAFADGTLYYDYGGKEQTVLTRTALEDYTFYYRNNDSDYYDLDELSFVADKSFEDDVTLTFRAYYSSSRYVDGTVTITAGKSSAKADITYEVAPGSRVNLDEDDFNDLFQDTYPNYTLDRVIFDRPDSSAFAEGTLYYDYGGKEQTVLTRTALEDYTFYYRNNDSDYYDLDELTFVADKDFEDDVTLSFRAYYSSSRYVDGTVTITAGKSSAKADITYEVAPGSRVNLDEDDFNDLFQDTYPNYTLDRVIFDRPDSSAFADGTLYYDYGGKEETVLTRTTLEDYVFYYRNNDSDYYDLDELTFVADKDFEDDVTLSFRAYYSSSRYVDGTLTITADESSAKADITYEVAPGDWVDLDEEDFNDFFQDTYSKYTLDHVIFDRPDSSAFADGTLYYDYGGGRDEIVLTRTTLEDYVFYYRNNDSDYYDLDKLTFVADKDFEDDVTLSFRAYYSSSRHVDGTVTISPEGKTTASLGGDIRYAATYGSKVQINANDIARFFSKSYPGYTLQYVTLGGVPSAGSLYYNYYGASKYGTSSALRLTASNYNSQVLYFSPSTTGQYALTELTYVPSGNNYCATIPFTAYGSGSRSVSGNILISVNSTTVSEVYGVTQRNTSVTFPAGSIYSAVTAATGISLSGIQLLSLPTSSQGTVYVGSGTSARAATNVLYGYSTGTQQINQLRFVPNSSFTGSVQIPYVAYNSSGTAFATGLFSIGVVNSTRSFKDVSSSTWCYKYVTELSDANVIDGYSDGSFKPDSTVTYGAALKLIMLAAGYSEQPAVNSNVFSGYLAKARADGIITRSDVDLTKPITRQQVAQIAAGAMKLDTSNLSSVQPFTDTTDASVRALNAAGIVEGYFNNGTSTYKPNNTLTRGQLSAIVWRMEQYNK